MEIDEFIEQDVLVFLDSRLEQQEGKDVRHAEMAVSSVYLTRDYEEELTSALDEGNIILAKRVLHDLKEKFDEIPPGTPDKAQVKELLSDLYERFKRSIAAPAGPRNSTTSVRSKLAEAKKLLGEGELKRSMLAYRNAKQAVLALKSVPDDLVREFSEVFTAIQRETNRPKPEEDWERIDEDLLLELEQQKIALDAALKANDLAGAMQTYKTMRMVAREIHDHKRAEDAAAKLVRVHEIIQTLAQHARKAIP